MSCSLHGKQHLVRDAEVLREFAPVCLENGRLKKWSKRLALVNATVLMAEMDSSGD
jgi:hypothetical protein